MTKSIYFVAFYLCVTTAFASAALMASIMVVEARSYENIHYAADG